MGGSVWKIPRRSPLKEAACQRAASPAPRPRPHSASELICLLSCHELEPYRGGRDLIPGPAVPHTPERATSLPASPAVHSHRPALAPVTSDRWAACYLLNSVLNRLGGRRGLVGAVQPLANPGRGETVQGLLVPLRVLGPVTQLWHDSDLKLQCPHFHRPQG